MEYSEEELEAERRIDDDYEVVNQYYKAKGIYPNMPFYLQDEKGETFVFGLDLIYQYLGNINHYPDW